jgi:hypothetical protein
LEVGVGGGVGLEFVVDVEAGGEWVSKGEKEKEKNKKKGGLLGDKVPVVLVGCRAGAALEAVGPEQFEAGVDGCRAGGYQREGGEQGESGAHGAGWEDDCLLSVI